MAMRDWVRLPSTWIERGGLRSLSWKHGGAGSDSIAALMALTVIAHAADSDTGVARITYDSICNLTGLSRAKLANGLEILRHIEVVEAGPCDARSTYKLVGYDSTKGWAKFPAKRMYLHGRIIAFDDLRLRKVAELDALKLFFLFVARRGNDTNLANIGYDKIEEYTGIKRVRIKTAISFLASLSLVYVEHIQSKINPNGISSAYRIVGIDSYNHMGTRGRNFEEIDLTV
jgi:hypothetical protein